MKFLSGYNVIQIKSIKELASLSEKNSNNSDKNNKQQTNNQKTFRLLAIHKNRSVPLKTKNEIQIDKDIIFW